MSERIFMALLVGAFFLMAAVFLYQRKKREKQIEELIMYLMRIQDGPELPEWTSYREGQLGILQSEIYKLVMLLHEKSSQAVKEREYLSKMLSDISHQIKTPLTSITIMADLLREPDLPEEKRMEFAGKIDQQVSRMTWLVRNLLTLSQLEADMLKLKKEDVEVRKLVQRAAEPLRLMADVKNVEISFEIDEDIHLICDEHWTVEAISNIIKNCLEHTPEGGRVTIRGEENNFSTNIYIRDNGEGIEKEDIAHIFERFYKGKNASENSVGIGLALSRQIMVQQNGTIDVKSEPGVGTEFHLKWYTLSRGA